MNMENLTKRELLMLFSILEGELEARDLVIESLQAQQKEKFIQERYGKYNLSDPFVALQRDHEKLHADNNEEKKPVCSSPLGVLKAVMSQCRKMQERMLAQLSAAESRHRKVIMDLEEERRRHALDAAEGDDVTYMLEKERERLMQQLEFEKSQVKKLEKEQKKFSSQLMEEQSRHKQLSSMLVKECKKATNKATEEGQKVTELNLKLEQERSKCIKLEEELAAEKKRGLHMEAQVEKQLSEFDIEREQLRAKLNREENRTKALKEELEILKNKMKEIQNLEIPKKSEAEKQNNSSKSDSEKQKCILISVGVGPETPEVVSTFCQTESVQIESEFSDNNTTVFSSTSIAATVQHAKLNGHSPTDFQRNGDCLINTGDRIQEKLDIENVVENSISTHRTSPVHTNMHITGGRSVSPSSTAGSSLSSSPCSSPVLAKRQISSSPHSSGYQSPYQAGVNQRFHAARHKFQSQAEQEQHVSGLQSPPPRDLSPTFSDSTAAKQMARNTVTQVLSRFTSQQASVKSTPNNSPFGTDYRSLASTACQKNDLNHSPTASKVSSPQSPLSPGIKSPTIPRAERGNPPPLPPKKPGLAQPPSSPNIYHKGLNQTTPVEVTADITNSNPINSTVTNSSDVDILLQANS
ncbi:CTTNBP2 N-terminal-like protein isoform X2 [Protopterus annectens]|nr:CTTNBP2 N-terminal-like protein isoform X2 [Protopterus annectens]XP_043932887.1 CTTNBP2 N-terminal-like protein isoform X2 [Protopterus annectens]XP_043932888.1 CTTNBP2 N-terminal-like protein isoform X2 [Protopterus annectens]XP_043932890.1 CTTNBP2 N-terminal-like protein isoform X2 [Protopterus annectens]